MGKRFRSEKRTAAVSGASPRLAFPLQLTRGRAWAIIAFGLCLTGLADFVSNQEAWFGPVYLMVIGFSAWSLGWREAVGVGLGCLAITLSINGSTLYPYGTAAAFWNMAMRMLAVVMIVALLDNARASCEREWRLARTDPLTGALNRQAFFELVGAGERLSSCSLVAYIDLDGLKKMNDELGHALGDRALKAFSDQVRRIIRKSDVFARLGGDEFVIYMLVKNEAAGRAVAARLHDALNTSRANSPAQLNCSIGALLLPRGRRQIDYALRVADELMYQAKQDGSGLAISTLSDHNPRPAPSIKRPERSLPEPKLEEVCSPSGYSLASAVETASIGVEKAF